MTLMGRRGLRLGMYSTIRKRKKQQQVKKKKRSTKRNDGFDDLVNKIALHEKRCSSFNYKAISRCKIDMDLRTKVPAAIASPSVVSVVSRRVPEWLGPTHEKYKQPGEEIVNWHSGTIIECEEDVHTHTYLTTIITEASLFQRTNILESHQFQVDVLLSDSDITKLCHATLLACDFHYNLAAIQIQTNSPLQTATLRALDDVVPIHPAPTETSSFHLLPHSNVFNIFPGTKIITLWRTFLPFNDLNVSSDVFWTTPATSFNANFDCNELCWLKEDNVPRPQEMRGGPVINCSGEVIGIAFHNSIFLPTNIILRWWKHFKSCRQYRRPWLGMKVANLYSSSLIFLEDFMRKFPDINTGVVVTKAAEDSLAYCSGIRSEDVIIECNGKLVCSKLQLFDIIWDKVGESVEVTVLRASTGGKKFKLSLMVEETTPDNFYMQVSWI